MKVSVRTVVTGLGVLLLVAGVWAWSPWASVAVLGGCLFVLGGFS